MLLQLDSLTWRRLNGVIVLNNKVRCQDFQCGQYNMWISLAASDVWKCTCTWFRWGRELMSDDKKVHWAWMGTVTQGGGAPVSPVQSVQIHTQCSVSQCTEMFIILAKTRTVTLSWIWYTKRHTQLLKKHVRKDAHVIPTPAPVHNCAKEVLHQGHAFGVKVMHVIVCCVLHWRFAHRSLTW